MSAFAPLCLAWLADMAALAAIGPLGKHPAPAMALYALGFLLLAVLMRSFPAGMPRGRANFLIFALGFSARLVFLFLFPANGDINRYIWEGAVQRYGFNPYSVAPDSPLLDEVAAGGLAAVRDGINHAGIPAIYPPGALLLFHAMAAVSPTHLFFKAVLTLCDVGVMAILALCLRRQELPARRLLLYALNPLAIVFVSGEGHLDVFMVFFLFLSWLLLQRGRTAGGFLALGLAVMSKYLAATALPFLMKPSHGRIRPLAALLPLACYLPFAEDGGRLLNTLIDFAAGMHYNDSISALVRAVAGPFGPAVLAGLLAAGLLWIFLIEDERWRAVYYALGWLLLLLPTLHPWYLVLIAPFMCFFPSRAWLYLQSAVCLTFPVLAIEYETGAFQEIQGLKILEYLPFFWLLALRVCRSRLPASTVSRPAALEREISVVIPTLNEAGLVRRCLGSIGNGNRTVEIVVADGGSDDRTAFIAQGLHARIVKCERGRGIQVRSGIEAARGDVLIVLHADCALRPGSLDRVLSALSARPESPGGCFGLDYDTPGWRSRLIARLNNLRAMTTGISFGNQAQFFRREALDRIGGYPRLMLMEDVEVSLRMRTLGRMLYLDRGVVASGRSRLKKSFAGYLLFVGGLFLRYLLDRRLGKAEKNNEIYYRKYYRLG
jgi:GT2 family glycosyltransferase